MKHLIKTLICVFTFTAFIAIKSFSQTVYVQENGKKYHMKNCKVAGTGKTGMSIAEAKKAGYTACAVCKPDEAAANTPKATDKPKAADKPKTDPASQKPKSTVAPK